MSYRELVANNPDNHPSDPNNMTAKERTVAAQQRIRRSMCWDFSGGSPWMAERIRMLSDGRASMVSLGRLEQLADRLEAADRDAVELVDLRAERQRLTGLLKRCVSWFGSSDCRNYPLEEEAATAISKAQPSTPTEEA